MRVLIVEDQQDLAEAIAGRLKKCGYAVDITSDGSEADEQLRCENYQLVVLDLILPLLGGKAILQELRRRRSMTPVGALQVAVWNLTTTRSLARPAVPPLCDSMIQEGYRQLLSNLWISWHLYKR